MNIYELNIYYFDGEENEIQRYFFRNYKAAKKESVKMVKDGRGNEPEIIKLQMATRPTKGDIVDFINRHFSSKY